MIRAVQRERRRTRPLKFVNLVVNPVTGPMTDETGETDETDDAALQKTRASSPPPASDISTRESSLSSKNNFRAPSGIIPATGGWNL